MIFEMRTYDLKVGKLNEFLTFYEHHGLPIQNRILGGLVCFLVSEIGPLNQVIHLWRYASLADRDSRREALLADPAWPGYVQRVPEYVERMQTRILKAAPFSPNPTG